jgi:UDP-glucose 4-epimerase
MFELNNPLAAYQGKRIVITGGAGFIGSALSNSLSTTSTVVAVDNLTTGSWERCKPGVQRIQLDIARCEDSKILEILEGSDYLFHLAAVKKHNRVNTFDSIIQNNVIATERLFRLATSAKTPRVIFSSSLYAYGSMGPSIMSENDEINPLSYYGLSKLVGENLLKIASEQGLISYIIPRLFFIYGPNQYAEGGYKSVIYKSFENILNGRPAEIYGSGLQVLDYVYLNDCVKSLLLLGTSSYQGIVNIASSVPTTVKQLIDEINTITENVYTIHSAPDWTEGSYRVGDNSRLKHLIGEIPSTSISEGLRETWNSMKGEYRC